MTPAHLYTLASPIYHLWPPTLRCHTRGQGSRHTLSWHLGPNAITPDTAALLIIAHAAPRIPNGAGCFIGTSKLNVFDLLTCLVRTYTMHNYPHPTVNRRSSP